MEEFFMKLNIVYGTIISYDRLKGGLNEEANCNSDNNMHNNAFFFWL